MLSPLIPISNILSRSRQLPHRHTSGAPVLVRHPDMMPSVEADVLDSTMMGFEDESSESDLGENGMEFSVDDDDMDGPDTHFGKDGEMIESYDKRELIVHEEEGGIDIDVELEPYEGMEFVSEDAARAFYDAYASRTGFRVRVSRCHRSMRDGKIICRRFVCSREGFYMQRNQTISKRQRTITRVGCMAMLMVKKHSPTKWAVSKFVKEHNHEPVALRKLDLKPCVVFKVKKVENGLEEKESPAKKLVLAAALSQRNSDIEPYEGMEFQSEETARTFYYAYAKDMGFTVRISKCRRSRDGSIICRRFVCSKEGYYVRKYGRTKRSRALTRVGCLARLIVKKLDSGIWVVANFEKEHNHPPFVIGEELSYQPPKPTRHINCDSSASLPASSRSLLNWTETDPQNGESSMTWRFNKLHQEGIRFAEEGATSVEIFNVAMFALQEATQKVVTAKNNVVMDSKFGNLANSSNHGGNTTKVNCANNSENQVVSSNNYISNVSRHDLLAIHIPNGQALQGGPENQQINITVPVAIQKQLSPAAQSLDGIGSVRPGMPGGKKHEYKTIEDAVLNFITAQDFGEGDSKQDGTATEPQEWNITGMSQAGSNNGSGDNSINTALSEAQVAALRAVAEAFNVPTMGATSSSAIPVEVLPLSDELLKGNRGCSLPCGSPSWQSFVEISPHQQHQQQQEETLTNPSAPNLLVHAAAIAAGARIAPPAVVASLIKAVQSRTAVHIRSAGSSMPKVQPPVRDGGGGGVIVGDSLLAPPPCSGGGEHHQASNVPYFGTGNQLPSSPPPLRSSGGITLPGDIQVPIMTTETSGMMQSDLASSVDQTDMSDAIRSEQEDHNTMMMMMMMYHRMDGGGPHNLAEQRA